MRSVVAVIACVGVTLTIAACGSDDTPAVPETATVTVSESGAAGASSAEAVPVRTDGATSGPAGSDRAASTPSQPFVNEANSRVDAQSFYTDGAAGRAYYFRSPTGNVMCGLGIPDPNLKYSGCQAISSVPGNKSVTCKNVGNSLYAVALYASNADGYCVNQPVYVGNGQNAGARGGKVLEYGQYIEAAGVVCRSTSYGITCTGGDGSFGFVLARDRNDVFGPTGAHH